jgi:hypothetical protein
MCLMPPRPRVLVAVYRYSGTSSERCALLVCVCVCALRSYCAVSCGYYSVLQQQLQCAVRWRWALGPGPGHTTTCARPPTTHTLLSLCQKCGAYTIRLLMYDMYYMHTHTRTQTQV